MLDLLQNIIRSFWEILYPIPMPWRAALIIFIALIVLYGLLGRLVPWLLTRLARLVLLLVESFVSLLLLPEYLITRLLRRLNLKPLPGTYVLSDALQGIVSVTHTGVTKLTDAIHSSWRLRKRWIILLTAVPIILWYVRPLLGEVTVASYIDRCIEGWYNVEARVLADAGVSPTRTMPEAKPTSPVTTKIYSAKTPTPRKPTRTPTRVPKSARTPTPTTDYEIYVVESGDSLNKIASRFDVTIEELITANKDRHPSLVTDPASIKVGWELRIPKSH